VKPDGDVDVEMKSDEASSPKDGDVSPITQSVLNLGDESKTSSRIGKKSEPTFEVRPNFSRVTPTQLAYISFPANNRYQPVRAVSAKMSPTKAGKAAAASGGRRTPLSTLAHGSESYAGGGGSTNCFLRIKYVKWRMQCHTVGRKKKRGAQDTSTCLGP
jgi:26S proteasome regulatory subunit N2